MGWPQDLLAGVMALVVYEGELVAAGEFTLSGGTPVTGIAAWNGTSWRPLGAGIGSDPATDFIGAMIVYNGTLVVAGRFAAAGGVPVANIARWDGATWQPLGEGLSGGSPFTSVKALAVHNGSLYAGGEFTIAGGVVSSYIARWDD